MFAMKITRLFLVIAALGVGTAAGAQTPATDTSRVSGMRRITETEYRNSIADIFGKDIQVQGRFEPDRRVGGLLAASGAILSITPTGLQSYNRMANSIASQVVDQKNRARLISCTPANAKAADTACARLVLSQYEMAYAFFADRFQMASWPRGLSWLEIWPPGPAIFTPAFVWRLRHS
jgi:hypothetical protein